MNRLLLLLTLVPCLVLGQHHNFKTYGDDEGLSNLDVRCLLQDRTGYLWIGTEKGLFRYDGQRFQAYGVADGLPSPRVNAIHQTVNGTLWVGTAGGLASQKGDRFEAANSGVAASVDGPAAIDSSAKNRLYVGTGRGLLLGDASEQGEKFHYQAAAAGEVISVHLDREGTLWFGCGAGLCRILHDQLKTETMSAVPAGPWTSIVETKDGDLWLRSAARLLRKHAGDDKFVATEVPGLQAGGGMQAALHDRDGALLLPTSHGLARHRENRWDLFTTEHGLPSNNVTAVLRDREGSLWLGLHGVGLARWMGYGEWDNWTSGDGLSGNSVRAMARPDGGTLWAGTENGLYEFSGDGTRGAWKQVRGLSGESVDQLAIAPSGGLWIIEDRRTVEILESGKIRRVSFSGPGTSGGIADLFFDRAGRAWLVADHAIYRTQGPANSSSEFERVETPDAQAGESFYQGTSARQGAVWIGSSRGLLRFDGGQWKRYGQADGLRQDAVGYVAEGSSGDIWIGYREGNGISRLNARENRLDIEHFNRQNALRSDRVTGLVLDGRARLWVPTDRGIDVLEDKRWRHYSRADGLVWDSCTGAIWGDRDGSVWIGSTRGASHFHPSDALAAVVAPAVVITSSRLDNADKSLAVTFAGLSFVKESEILFQYRLLHWDSHWIESSAPEAHYSNLSPGNYTFEVIARNSQGVWSDQVARFPVAIERPWWRGPWVLLPCLLGLGWLTFHGYRRTIGKSLRERNEMEEAIKDVSRELLVERSLLGEERRRAADSERRRTRFLSNSRHELQNPMSEILEKMQAALTKNLTPAQVEDLEDTKDSTGSLLALLNNVLDYSKMDAGKLELERVEFSLRDTVAEVIRGLAGDAEMKRVELSTRCASAVPDRLLGDPDRLRQVLRNLVRNAIEFSGGGPVLVQVDGSRQAGNRVALAISVTDHGPGIARDKQESIFDPPRPGENGMGLAICKRLTVLMGGKIWLESTPGEGTAFHFTAVLEEPARLAANA